MQWSRFVVAMTACVLAGLVMAGSASACTCRALPPDEALREVDAAIVATLVEVVHLDEGSGEFRYRVERVYKLGSGLRPGGTVGVRTALHGATCGLPGEIGRRYGLYLGRRAGYWRGSLCGLFDPSEMAALFRGVRRNADIGGSSDPDAGASCAV